MNIASFRPGQTCDFRWWTYSPIQVLIISALLLQLRADCLTSSGVMRVGRLVFEFLMRFIWRGSGWLLRLKLRFDIRLRLWWDKSFDAFSTTRTLFMGHKYKQGWMHSFNGFRFSEFDNKKEIELTKVFVKMVELHLEPIQTIVQILNFST